MKKYQLVWEDQFMVDGMPDETVWQYETGGNGFGNNEQQFYTNRTENAFVKDGKLHIVAHKEVFENRSYTSAKLTTYLKKSIKYGRIEVSAKLPKGRGTWPAIWLLPNDIHQGVQWPLSGEIDMMEHVGKEPDTVHFSLHSQSFNHRKHNQIVHHTEYKDIADKFVEYALEWDQKSLVFYIDKKAVFKVYKKEDYTMNEWPYDKPYYIILNLAIGGWWGGDIDESILPASFIIDYVKVFEEKI